MEKTQQNLIGTPPGATGSSTPSSVVDLATRLAAITPEEALNRLVDGLQTFHNIALTRRSVRSPGQPSLRVSSQPTPAAAEFADKFFCPAPDGFLRDATVALLAGLRVFSGGDDIEREFAIAPFVTELRKYPADCAIKALREGRKHGPKVQAEDVGKDAAAMCADRYLIRHAIQWAIKNPDAMKWETMTDADRERNRQAVLEMINASRKP